MTHTHKHTSHLVLAFYIKETMLRTILLFLTNLKIKRGFFENLLGMGDRIVIELRLIWNYGEVALRMW